MGTKGMRWKWQSRAETRHVQYIHKIDLELGLLESRTARWQHNSSMMERLMTMLNDIYIYIYIIFFSFIFISD